MESWEYRLFVEGVLSYSKHHIMNYPFQVLLPESMITIAQKIKKMTRDEALDFLTTQAFYTRTEELQRNHLTI